MPRVRIPILLCLRCRHRWPPRQPNVDRCPKCKSTSWHLPPPTRIRRLDCKRCGHEWTPRRATRTLCPKCKSKHWQTPRRRRPDPWRRNYELTREILLEKKRVEPKDSRRKAARRAKLVADVDAIVAKRGVVDIPPE